MLTGVTSKQYLTWERTSLCYYKYGMSVFSVNSLSHLLNITCTDNDIEYTTALCNELITLRDQQLDIILIYKNIMIFLIIYTKCK